MVDILDKAIEPEKCGGRSRSGVVLAESGSLRGNRLWIREVSDYDRFRTGLSGEPPLASIELRKLAKVYPGGIEGLRPIDLSVKSGELLVLLGPSGSGKSTIFRLIAGLERPTSGSVCIDGREMRESRPIDATWRWFFRIPALYPHLSVFGNLVFGVRGRGVSRAQARSRVNQRGGDTGARPRAGPKAERAFRR